MPAEHQEPFDGVGMVLAGIGVAGLAFGLSVAGLDILPWPIVVALVGVGAVAMTAYVFHSWRVPAPILDFSLLRIPTFNASLIGGYLFRLGIGAMPFLLPLMLQTGFGMTPFQSGLVTFAGALGAIGMKTVASRTIATLWLQARDDRQRDHLASIFIAACAIFRPGMPVTVLTLILLIGGFLPRARIHRGQHHCLCRYRSAPHEPRDGAGLRRPATIDLDRCRGRCAARRNVTEMARRRPS